MNDSFRQEFIDLTKFNKQRYLHIYDYGLNFAHAYEIIEKDTQIKYMYNEANKLFYDFSRNEIISLSQEINTLSKISHPSILKYIGYNPINYENEPYPVIITESTTDYTLNNILRPEKKSKNYHQLNDTEKLIIIYGIAAGMSFLHSHNIIHCDLKPENVLFDCNLYPKIFRFHLAKQISDDLDQISSELVGTLVYLAPEILKEKKYSKKSDVYAFSLILYEILTNEKPFHDFDDNMNLIEKVKCQKFRPKINKNISQFYKNLIEKCWSQEPQDRPSFDEILYILKNDSSFITEQVNKEEYFKYIEFIESSNFSFDNTKKIHHFDHIINTQLQFFNQQYLFDFNSKYSTCINPVVFNGYMFDLSDFEKHEKLGEGSFGRVFKIVNKENGLIYAAKESFKYFNDFSDTLISGLRNEILVLSKFNHPTILKYIGFNYYNIKNKPKPTFILEYASNGSLYDILELERNGKKVKEWTNTKKLITIYGIASAIKYIHSRNYIHRDLKPQNILFDDYLYPKVTDFTFSLFLNDPDSNENNQDISVPGTPEYIAPEILINSGVFERTKSSDIYSISIIMYEIMTGERPFKDLKNPIDIVNEVTNNGRPKFNKQIPVNYRRLIECCWDPDPNNRPTCEQITCFLETPDFITEDINEVEFSNYVNYIKSSKHIFDAQSNKNSYSLEKVNIYLNRTKTHEMRNLSIDINPIELNKYEITKQIGEGGFGTVYKVTNKETGGLFAAKIAIYDINYCSKDVITNFEREVNIISKLNHPSIMQFIGFNLLNFKYKPKPTIITEFLSNGSLDKIIELERMSIGFLDWDDTKKLINIFGIASGLSYLHSLNILHRDLKPANILLDDYLFPKISDFGLSKQIFENQTQNDSGYKGTCAYTAPEVFEGKYSKAGDVYSFALIVYEIITIEVLFPKFNQYQVMTQVREGFRPPFNFPIPSCYKKLITDC